MSRVGFVPHQGKRLLHIDLSECSPEERRQTITAAKAIIAAQPPASVLTLTDVKGTPLSPEANRDMEEFAAHNRPYVKAAALVNVDRLQAILVRSVAIVTRRKLATFGSFEEAKDWLVAQ